MNKIYLFFGLTIFSTGLFAQTSITPTNSPPDAKAMLDVVASDKGLLLPRVDLNAVGTGVGNLASSNPEALIVYNTNAGYVNGKGYFYWNGSSWVKLSTGGTVTNVSVTTANGVSGTVASSTSTPAISLSLGAITPTSVAATGTVTGSNISGTNTGDQIITLTGDITGSGTGSFITNIEANTVGATEIISTSVSPGSYGNSTQVGTFTVDADGRLTAAGNTTISGVAPGGSAGGDLTGSYPNPTIASNAVGSAEITDGTVANADLTNSSVTVSPGTGLSGGGTVALGGTITLTNTGDLSNTNEAQTITAGGTTSPTISLNTVGGAGGGTVTLLAGTGIGLSQSGGLITVTNSGGTVTNVSVTTANGVSGTVANSTSTPAISLTLGAITPTSVAATGTVTGSNISGTNTGDQIITLTGDITGSGTGSFITNIEANTVGATEIISTSVSPGSYGNSTQVGTFTVDADGRLTAAGNTTISGVAPGGSAGGDLTGTYPNPTIASNAVGSAEITDGTVANADLTNSSVTVSPGTGLSGGGIVALGGTITLTNTGDLSNTNEAQTITAGGTTSPTISLNTVGGAGGGIVTLLAGTGIGLSQSAGSITVTNSGGTVTNFSAGDLSPLFTTTEATTTSTPALSFSLSNAAAYSVLGNNTSSAASPSYTTGPITNRHGLAGTSSGIVTIQPQTAAGTYNFNLPTTAGTAGQPLLSGGGAAAAMTFGTLGVGAGGTGATSLTGVLKGNGTSAITAMNGTANYLSRWTDANTIGIGATQDNGTDVGIGVAPGTYKLNVNGTISAADFGAAGSQNVRIGDDAFFSDLDIAHTIGLYSTTAGSGRLAVGATTETLIRSTDQTGSYGNADAFDFDDGGADAGIIVESGTGESGGVFANGNTAAIWSPGDGTGGILSVYDEDAMNLTTPVVRVNGSGDLEARNGLYSKKRYTYFTATRRSDNGGTNPRAETYNLGSRDLCSLAAFSQLIDEDDGDQSHDTQCNVYMDNSGLRGDGIGNSNSGETLTYDFAYNAKPNWRLYVETYGSKNWAYVTCSAICIDFDY